MEASAVSGRTAWSKATYRNVYFDFSVHTGYVVVPLLKIGFSSKSGSTGAAAVKDRFAICSNGGQN